MELWHFSGDISVWTFQKSYSYSFHLLLAKLYEDIGYHGRIQTVLQIYGILNLNMGLNGKIPNCAMFLENSSW